MQPSAGSAWPALRCKACCLVPEAWCMYSNCRQGNAGRVLVPSSCTLAAAMQMTYNAVRTVLLCRGRYGACPLRLKEVVVRLYAITADPQPPERFFGIWLRSRCPDVSELTVEGAAIVISLQGRRAATEAEKCAAKAQGKRHARNMLQNVALGIVFNEHNPCTTANGYTTCDAVPCAQTLDALRGHV